MKKVKDMLRKGRISEENHDAVIEMFGNDKCKKIRDMDYYNLLHSNFSCVFQDGQTQIFNKKVNPLKEAVFVSYYKMKQTNNVYIYIYQPKATDHVYKMYSLYTIENISEFFNAYSIKNGLPCEETFDSLSPKKEYLFISKEAIVSENKQSYLMARYCPR